MYIMGDMDIYIIVYSIFLIFYDPGSQAGGTWPQAAKVLDGLRRLSLG